MLYRPSDIMMNLSAKEKWWEEQGGMHVQGKRGAEDRGAMPEGDPLPGSFFTSLQRAPMGQQGTGCLENTETNQMHMYLEELASKTCTQERLR